MFLTELLHHDVQEWLSNMGIDQLQLAIIMIMDDLHHAGDDRGRMHVAFDH